MKGRRLEGLIVALAVPHAIFPFIVQSVARREVNQTMIPGIINAGRSLDLGLCADKAVTTKENDARETKVRKLTTSLGTETKRKVSNEAHVFTYINPSIPQGGSLETNGNTRTGGGLVALGQ